MHRGRLFWVTWCICEFGCHCESSWCSSGTLTAKKTFASLLYPCTLIHTCAYLSLRVKLKLKRNCFELKQTYALCVTCPVFSLGMSAATAMCILCIKYNYEFLFIDNLPAKIKKNQNDENIYIKHSHTDQHFDVR